MYGVRAASRGSVVKGVQAIGTAGRCGRSHQREGSSRRADEHSHRLGSCVGGALRCIKGDLVDAARIQLNVLADGVVLSLDETNLGPFGRIGILVSEIAAIGGNPGASAEGPGIVFRLVLVPAGLTRHVRGLEAPVRNEVGRCWRGALKT